MNIDLAANQRVRIRYNYATHVTRTMGGVGKFNVSLGQDVRPDQVLGTYQVPSGFFSIDLAKRLGVSTDSADKYLQRPISANIYKGELLALKKSVFGNNVLTSPTDGLIEGYDKHSGVLKIKFFPKEVNLAAGVYGIVDHIDTARGQVVLKTFVQEINAVLGAGKQRMGLLKLIKNASNLTKQAQITADMSQHIVMTGALLEYDAIMKSVQLGVLGLITGGVNHRGFKPLTNSFEANNNIITDVGITLVVTEGFGAIPVGNDIYQLLLKYEDQFVFIGGNPPKVLLPSSSPDSIISLRNLILPLEQSAPDQSDLGIANIAIGLSARVVWPPFQGSIGQIVAIDQTPSTLESGISTYLLTIETNSRKIKVPYPNVELV